MPKRARRATWQDIRAARSQGESRSAARQAAILRDCLPEQYANFSVGPLPGIGAHIAPVKIYAADGSLKEVVSAQEFRSRSDPQRTAQAEEWKQRRAKAQNGRWRTGGRRVKRPIKMGDMHHLRLDGAI